MNDLEKKPSEDITLSGDELDTMLEGADLSTMEDISVLNESRAESVDNNSDWDEGLSDLESNTISEIDLDSTEQEVKLSVDEMDNILNDADISEVELESLEKDKELTLPEDLDMSEETGMSDLKNEGSNEETYEPDLLNHQLDSPSPDLSQLPDLDEIDDVVSSQDDLNETEESSNDTWNDSEDETVALSVNELDNILENVDESQVLDLEKSSKSPNAIFDDENGLTENNGSEIVSLSDEETNSVIEDASDLLGSNTVSFDDTKSDEDDNVKESLEFEKEIMGEAQINAEASNDLKSSSPVEGRIVDLKDDILVESNGMDEKVEKVDNALKNKVTPKQTINPVNKLSKLSKLSVKKKAEEIPDLELYELFSYLDKLLDNLPEHNIKEFAESKYYDKYISIINRLGI